MLDPPLSPLFLFLNHRILTLDPSMTRYRYVLATTLVVVLLFDTELEAGKAAREPRDRRAHTVRATETLSTIALRYRVSVNDLKQWNRLASDRILEGQELAVFGPGESGHYIVRAGDTLSGIAARASVSVTRLKRSNGLTHDRITVGKKLRLPARGAGEEHEPTHHTVRRGGTLSAISQLYGIRLTTLRKLNGVVDGDHITVGQRLALRQRPAPARSTRNAPPPPSTNSVEEEVREYVVRSGDTLSEIAQHFDVGLGLLRQLNKLKKDRIIPGQKLRVRPSREDEGVHIVRRGETLSEIAARYRLELSTLKEINGVEGDRILIGQKLRLRQVSTATHVVERGDALWEIARAYDMKVGELKELNGLTSDRIYPGQELTLNSERASRYANYQIIRGDNLSEIARLHQMTVGELRKLNGLKGSVIHPGQQLRVRPILGNRNWLKQSEIRWADLQITPHGLNRIDLGNGPYFKARPKADQQRSLTYYEEHPISPLATYRQANKVWEGFERAVDRLGQLSNALQGWHLVLDPGHGGLDPGAVVKTHDGNGNELYVVEDEYVYDIALRAYVLLRLHGARVHMTLLSPNHLIRHNGPPSLTFVNEKNEVYNSLSLNKRNRRENWPVGGRNGNLAARVRIAREAFSGIPSNRCVFLSFHADKDPRAPEAPLVLYYESRDGRRRDNPSRQFAQTLLPALGAGARTRGQALGVLRNNPAGVKVLVELRNLAYVDHAWALRFEQLRHRDAEKVVKGVLDYARQRQLSARR